MAHFDTPVSLEAALEHLDPFNNPAARAHFETQLVRRKMTRTI
jgi:hypothetical protein